MIRAIDITDMNQVLELLMLQQLSYRVEADRIGFEEIPPLWDTPKSIQESGERFFGFYEEDRLAGAVAVKQSAKEFVICRMMVHPEYFRRGIANRLLLFAEQLAMPGTPIKVSTGTKNDPAVMLYTKHGYEPSQLIEIAPDVTLTVFYKKARPNENK